MAISLYRIHYLTSYQLKQYKTVKITNMRSKRAKKNYCKIVNRLRLRQQTHTPLIFLLPPFVMPITIESRIR